MFGASSLLTACANQSETNTTIETRQVVADPEYEVKSPYNLISYGHGLYYEEVDPSDRRSTDEIPADYIQIEYLQSTWKQWIDTGYIPNIETQIEAKFFVPNNFGANVTDSGHDSMYYNYVLYSNRVNLRYQSVSIGGYSQNYVYLRQNVINEIFLSATSYTLTANGTQYENLSFSATTFSGATSLRMFKSVDGELDNYTKPDFKLYSLKISEKDSTTGDVTYVRDFVPCVKDNVTGLFDVVEQKFYTNVDGNGSFNMHNDMQGSGTENDPYQISCMSDLISFYGIANGDEYYVVTTDIKLNDGYFERNADGTCTYHDGGDGVLYDWSNPCVFFKKFDGGNHKFENFYSTSMGFLTLARYNAQNGGTLSQVRDPNVEVCNVELSGYYTDENASLVLGKNVAMMFTSYYQKTTATVSNCKVDGCVYITQNNIYRASLLCTWWRDSNIYGNEPYGIMNMKNCVASGNVKAKYACGLCVYNKNAVSVSNCINFANVSAVESSAAGIIYNEFSGGGNLTLENCKNYGKVTGNDYAVAGLAISNKGTYKNCYNYGEVLNLSTKTGSNYCSQAGGIAAGQSRNPDLYYKFYSCGNEGNVTASGKVAAGIFGCETYSGSSSQMYFENCYNKGDICAKANFAVGISGWLRNAKNCANYGKVYTKVISNSSGSASGLFFRFAANATEPYIINCKNYGNVTSHYSGATGIILQTDCQAAVIYGCNNYGDICSLQGSAVGLTYAATNNMIIKNCANYGNITASSGYVSGLVYIIGENASTIIDIENCANYGKLTGGQYVGGIEVGRVSQMTLSIRNCISAGEIKHKYNTASASFPIYHTTGAGIRATAKNCIVDCKVLGQQKKQFWGDDFSGFFVNRMTGRVGLKELEGIGRYMLPIPSASYLENDLNFTRVA